MSDKLKKRDDDKLVIKYDLPQDPTALFHFGDIELPSKREAEKKRERVKEGRELVTIEEAIRLAEKYDIENPKPKDPKMILGGVRVPTKTNVFYIGQTQTGKTSAMKLHIAQVLDRIRRLGSKEKVVIFDASNELIPFIYAYVGDSAPVYILNPSDDRCYQWDISADIDGASNILDLTHTLVKEKQGDTPFFTEGARSLIEAVINAFFLTVVKDQKEIEWTLRDVVCAIATPQRIEQTIRLQPQHLSYIKEAFLDRNNQDVYSSLIARTRELRIVGAMWHNRPKFSLKEFFDSDRGGVLVLGSDEKNQAIMYELSRLILERAGKIIGDSRASDEPKYWFFLDEFQKLGRTDTLIRLITEGLKRGVRVHLATQNWANVVKAYGEQEAEILYSECGAKYLFRAGSDKTAEQARTAIGKRKIDRQLSSSSVGINDSISTTSSYSGGFQNSHTNGTSSNGIQPATSSSSDTAGTSGTIGLSVTRSEGFSANSGRQQQIVIDEPAISTGALTGLEEGEFYCLNPFFKDFWHYKYRWQDIMGTVTAESILPNHSAHIKRTDKQNDVLKDWEEDDFRRLGLKEVKRRSEKRPPEEDEEMSQFDVLKQKFSG